MSTVAELKRQLNQLVRLLDEVWCAKVFDSHAAHMINLNLRATLKRLELTVMSASDERHSVKIESTVSTEVQV